MNKGVGGTFDLKVQSISWSNRGESKAIFHKDLTDDYFAELLLELNKLDNFKIETEKQELTKIQNNQFSDCTAVGDFNFGALKGITKFKVAKFEKVLQLLNFPKVIEVVNRELEDKKLYDLINIYSSEFDYHNSFPKTDPFKNYRELNHKLTYKLKTDKYDYTRLFKLLNFPEEMTVGNGNAKYKLIDDAYVFHTWNCATEDWQNEYEEYLKMKGKLND